MRWRERGDLLVIIQLLIDYDEEDWRLTGKKGSEVLNGVAN